MRWYEIRSYRPTRALCAAFPRDGPSLLARHRKSQITPTVHTRAPDFILSQTLSCPIMRMVSDPVIACHQSYSTGRLLHGDV